MELLLLVFKSTAYCSETSSIMPIKEEIPEQLSARIIGVYGEDAGNYQLLMLEFPKMPRIAIRTHMNKLFKWSLDQIQRETQRNNVKIIQKWTKEETGDIMRELHRIRCTNRLLSQANVDFRETFNWLMLKYYEVSPVFEPQRMTLLYKTIQIYCKGTFVSSFNRKPKDFASPHFTAGNRSAILEGGFYFSKKTEGEKVELKSENASDVDLKAKPEMMIHLWRQEEVKTLSRLCFLSEFDTDFMLASLCEKYGVKPYWRDFYMVNQKVDHLIKLGLLSLEQLLNRYLPLLCQPPNPTHSVFRNVVLLNRQIFGHVESAKVKMALVKIYSQSDPSKQDILIAVKEINKFVDFTRQEERMKRITDPKHAKRFKHQILEEKVVEKLIQYLEQEA